MGRQKPDRVKVKVIAKRGRKYLLLRWRDPVLGSWSEESTEIPVGDGQRDRNRARGDAERIAATKENELAVKFAQREESLTDLLETWRAWMTDNGTSEKQAAANVSKLTTFSEVAEVHLVSQITEDTATAFLTRLRKVGAIPPGGRSENDKRKKPRPASPQTRNHYLVQIRSFCAWLVRRGTLPSNPLEEIRPQPVEVDRRRVRRHVGAEDFRKLLEAAAAGPMVESVSGADRAAIYLVATWTGFRRKELARLTVRSLRFTDDPPAIHLGAEFSKNKRKSVIPLHPDLANRLKTWLASKGVVEIDAPLFPLITAGGYLRDTAAMMRVDLKAAGIDYEGADGFADFHALRHTFVSNLEIAGIPLAQMQRLARHMDPKTTMRYSHSTEQRKAVEIAKLPAPPDLPAPKKGDDPDVLKFKSG